MQLLIQIFSILSCMYIIVDDLLTGLKGEILKQMMKEKRDELEAEERRQNNGQLTRATQAAHRAADQSEEVTGQMLQAQGDAPGYGNMIPGPSSALPGHWKFQMSKESTTEPLLWTYPNQRPR